MRKRIDEAIGCAFEPYPKEWGPELKQSIRRRDDYTCQACGAVETGRAFPVHHLDFDVENCSRENLVTLCRQCHSRVTAKRFLLAWQTPPVKNGETPKRCLMVVGTAKPKETSSAKHTDRNGTMLTRLSFYVSEENVETAKQLVNRLGVRTMSELFRRMIANYTDLVEGRLVPASVARRPREPREINFAESDKSTD